MKRRRPGGPHGARVQERQPRPPTGESCCDGGAGHESALVVPSDSGRGDVLQVGQGRGSTGVRCFVASDPRGYFKRVCFATCHSPEAESERMATSDLTRPANRSYQIVELGKYMRICAIPTRSISLTCTSASARV
jgi:hypothetical protein